MTLHRRSLIGTLATVALLGTGCYPEQPTDITSFDLVFTASSPSFDFANALTYAIPDSVVLVTGNLTEGELPEMVDPLYGDQIIDRIRRNMDSRGWSEVNAADSPDVIFLPAVSKTENVTVYNWGYWGWYYPYAPGWGWYYPGYVPSYSSYTSGSLIMLMNVPADVSASNNVPIVWVGLVNGLLEGTSSTLLDRIESTIDEAFEQSPVLKR
ncbi:MAG: DUF4136 domain-containing protein [Flavobacteriales bacterium]